MLDLHEHYNDGLRQLNKSLENMMRNSNGGGDGDGGFEIDGDGDDEDGGNDADRDNDGFQVKVVDADQAARRATILAPPVAGAADPYAFAFVINGV